MIVAFDTETWLVSPGRLAPPLVCGSFATSVGADLCDRDSTIARIRDILSDPGIGIVGHNIAYDAAVTIAAAPDLLALWFAAYAADRVTDTMIRERLANLSTDTLEFDHKGRRRAYSLAALVARYLRLDICTSKGADTWRYRYRDLDGVPIAQWPEAAVQYARDDATHTLAVYHAQGGHIANEYAQARAAFALHLASCYGLRVDAARLAVVTQALTVEAHAMDDRLVAAGLQRESGSECIKAIEERLVAAYGGAPPRKPPTALMAQAGAEGNIRRDGVTLLESGDPLLIEYAAVKRARDTLRGTARALRAGTMYPINNRYTVVLRTGRVSSSNPNLQNIPRRGGLRECIHAGAGRVLIACDYAQIELCALAQVCLWLFGTSRLADAINAGVDVHLLLAAELLGSPVEALDKHTHHDERQFCKAGNYGFGGGMGVRKFWHTLRKSIYRGDLPDSFLSKTEADCARLRVAWFRAWPEMDPYLREYVANLAEVGMGFTHPMSGRVRGGGTFCQIANAHFQGLAGDGATDAVWRVTREAYTDQTSPLYGCRIVAFVHDEILLAAPADRYAPAAQRLSVIMRDTMCEYLPDVRVDAPAAAMRYWTKGAEPMYDTSGNLVLWAPPNGDV